MKIDTDHLHHWMRAIRQSQNPIRTLDAFWKGQIDSKEWLLQKLRPYVFKTFGVRKVTIEIHGGWVGVLSSMIFQSDIPVKNIVSIDIDPECKDIALTMNQLELEEGRFKAITSDICDFKSKSDIVINTSFEHITEIQYYKWLDNLTNDSIIALQSNNYDIPEHVRIAKNLEEFVSQTKLSTVLYQGQLEHSLYTRFMVIGKK